VGNWKKCAAVLGFFVLSGAVCSVASAQTGGNDVQGAFRGFGVAIESSAMSVDLNAHYLFPQATNRQFTPYVLAGLGLLRVSASATMFGVRNDGEP